MSRRKLLLADDSITIQKVVNLTFADEGVDVITVGDGDAALAELSSARPDILLADVNMPGPSGYDICERLRADESTRNLPVILLVGSFEPFDEAEASRVGANAYLTKPFQSIKQLIAQVNELIEAAAPSVEEHADEEPVLDTQVVAEPAAQESTFAVPVEEVSADAVEESIAEQVSGVVEETVPPPVSDSAPRYFDDLGYETTVSPVGSAETPPQPDEIESLYAESLSGDGNGLSDVGIDDEMIETSYSAAADNDLAEFSSEVEADSGSYEAEPPPAETTGEIYSGPVDSGDPASFVSGYEQRFSEDPSRFENTISYENWQPADMRTEDAAPSPAEVPQSFETTRLDGSFPQEIEQEIEQEHAAPAIGEDTIRMENRFDTTGSHSFQFDDVNLLDLSNNSEAPVEITTPVNAVEQGSNKQVVTLAPELIEMIAQRVVEKLSEKY